MPPSLWLVTRFSASRPNPRPVTVVEKVRRKSCGVARSTPSLLQTARMMASRPRTGPTRAPLNTNPVEAPSSASFANSACACSDNHTRCPCAFLVPGQPSDGTGSPGISVLASHVRNLAGALAGDQDHLQGGAGDQAGGVERCPERRDFAVRQNA